MALTPAPVDGKKSVPGCTTDYQLLEMFSEPIVEFSTTNSKYLRSSSGTAAGLELDVGGDEKFEINKLLRAFCDFGVNPSTSKLIELQNKLSVNDGKFVGFRNFVEVVKDVFRKELIDRIISKGNAADFKFDINNLSQKNHDLQLENSKLGEEIIILKKQLKCMENACSCIEDDLLTTRKELQNCIECMRKLKGDREVELTQKRFSVADYERGNKVITNQESVKVKERNPDFCKENNRLKEEVKRLRTANSVFKATTYKLLFFLEELQSNLVELLHTPRKKVGRSFSLYRNIACGNAAQCNTSHPQGSVARAASLCTPINGDNFQRQMKQIHYDTLVEMARKMKDILAVSKEMMKVECLGRKEIKDLQHHSLNPLCFSNASVIRNPLHDLPPKTTITIMSRV